MERCHSLYTLQTMLLYTPLSLSLKEILQHTVLLTVVFCLMVLYYIVVDLSVGTNANGFFLCNMSLASWNVNSNFSLQYLTLNDINQNSVQFNCSDPLSACFNKTFTVTTPTDTLPPVLHGYRMFSGGYITVYIYITLKHIDCKGSFIDLDISDDISGISSVVFLHSLDTDNAIPKLVAGELLNGTFRAYVSFSSGRQILVFVLSVTLYDRAGNSQNFPIHDVYQFNAGKSY